MKSVNPIQKRTNWWLQLVNGFLLPFASAVGTFDWKICIKKSKCSLNRCSFYHSQWKASKLRWGLMQGSLRLKRISIEYCKTKPTLVKTANRRKNITVSRWEVKKDTRKMLGARKKASSLVRNELSLASWHLIGWEDGEKFLDQSRSEERWDPHYFRPYSGIALQSTRRDSIHNLLPHCNVISLR